MSKIAYVVMCASLCVVGQVVAGYNNYEFHRNLTCKQSVVSSQSTDSSVTSLSNNSFFAHRVIEAIKRGDIELLESYASVGVNFAWSCGVTPLYVATKLGNITLVKYLIDNGAHVDNVNNTGEGALHVAVALGYMDIVEFLINEGANINITDNMNNVPLHIAAKVGNVDMVNYLMANGADIAATNKRNETALYVASANERNHVVLAILQFGMRNMQHKIRVNVNTPRFDGDFPLQVAAEHGNEALVDILLSYGSQVDMRSKGGLTALNIAVLSGKEEVIKTLLQYKANTEIGDLNNNTPLIHAVLGGNYRIVHRLINAYANVNNTNNQGRSPLMIAMDLELFGIARLLCNHGAVHVIRAKKYLQQFLEITDKFPVINIHNMQPQTSESGSIPNTQNIQNAFSRSQSFKSRYAIYY